jgi:hypothetical protein
MPKPIKPQGVGTGTGSFTGDDKGAFTGETTGAFTGTGAAGAFKGAATGVGSGKDTGTGMGAFTGGVTGVLTGTGADTGLGARAVGAFTGAVKGVGSGIEGTGTAGKGDLTGAFIGILLGEALGRSDILTGALTGTWTVGTGAFTGTLTGVLLGAALGDRDVLIGAFTGATTGVGKDNGDGTSTDCFLANRAISFGSPYTKRSPVTGTNANPSGWFVIGRLNVPPIKVPSIFDFRIILLSWDKTYKDWLIGSYAMSEISVMRLVHAGKRCTSSNNS